MSNINTIVDWIHEKAVKENIVAQLALSIICDPGYREAFGLGRDRFRFKRTKYYKSFSKSIKAGKANEKIFRRNRESGGGGIVRIHANAVCGDNIESAYWCLQAAKQGCAEAQCIIGRCFEVGSGVVEDDLKALSWFAKAARKGHQMAHMFFHTRYNHMISHKDGWLNSPEATEYIKVMPALENSLSEMEENYSVSRDTFETENREIVKVAKHVRSLFEKGNEYAQPKVLLEPNTEDRILSSLKYYKQAIEESESIEKEFLASYWHFLK
jgi:TPR repeat protein